MRSPSVAWPGLTLAAALAGCVENKVTPQGDAGAEGASEAPTCPGTAPEDRAAEPASTCTLPAPDWDLVEEWRWTDDLLGSRQAMIGRFEDANGDGIITVRDPNQVMLVNSAGNDRHNSLFVLSATGEVQSRDHDLEGWSMYPTLGDADPTRVGMELLLFGRSPEHTEDAAAVAPGTVLYLTTVAADPENNSVRPFLADLDADGAAEVLAAAATSALDGETLFPISDPDSHGFDTVAGDLDLDGLPEIIAAFGDEPTVLDAQGQVRAVCPVAPTASSSMFFAIGNLDDDDEGEFVVARSGVLAICEADGTLATSTTTGATGTWRVGIGELTGDEAPEVVVAEYVDDTTPASIAVYDRRLTLLWRTPMPDGNDTVSFALADLDGDGRHEVIAKGDWGDLVILGPDGETLAQVRFGFEDSYGPIVTDLDGDGLAEVVVDGDDPKIAVLTNPSGGWPVRGAEYPWPGPNHFPGDRNLDGTLPDPADVHWLKPGHNVWQGLAAGPPDLPDLGVTLEGACSDDCETTWITAWVSNHGAADAPMPVTVTLTNLDDGAVLATEVVDDLPSGVKRALLFEVSTETIGSGVRASATTPWAECSDTPNEAELTDLPCRLPTR